ncbi:MAG: response regulator [Bacteroidetes bacterium]|nr:response regulator [Bacteroidota bacterium]
MDQNQTMNRSEPTQEKKLAILVVEDNAINLRLITAALTRAGHKVDTATDGQIALDKFSGNSYDAILMDIMMPVMDGLTATREIRKLEAERGSGKGKRVKIIAITANAFEDDRNKFFESGMDFYMNKPIEIEELNRILQL